MLALATSSSQDPRLVPGLILIGWLAVSCAGGSPSDATGVVDGDPPGAAGPVAVADAGDDAAVGDSDGAGAGDGAGGGDDDGVDDGAPLPADGNDAGGGGAGPPPGGGSDGGDDDAGSPQAPPRFPRGFGDDVVLPETPGRIVDSYAPSAPPRRVVVFLHGGGGSKDAVAGQLGLTELPQAGLDALGALWILPQGEALDANPRTWSNHVMTSGEDDLGFLVRLAGVLRDEWPTASLVLAGHSNGGMMTHRVWCEAGEAYDEYVSVAGPPSVRFDPADPERGALPCTGSRPYRAIVGNADHVLATEGNMLAATWSIADRLVDASPDAFLDPTLMNEVRAHRALRAPALCRGEPLAAPVDVPAANPRRREVSDCDGRLRLWLVLSQQDYPVFALGNHTIANLQNDGDFVLREVIAAGVD
jgi:predicted esterase